MIFLQEFTFVFRHRAGQQNKAVDALNRRHNLLIILRAKLISFEYLPTTYAHDEDFGEIGLNAAAITTWENIIFKRDNYSKGINFVFQFLPSGYN